VLPQLKSWRSSTRSPENGPGFHGPYAGKACRGHHQALRACGGSADEEGSRSKERYFSPRDAQNDWNVDDQPPELWRYFKTDFEPGTHVRVHPLLDWTELNVWEYIEREDPSSLYFANGSGALPLLGCWPYRCSTKNVADIIAELHGPSQYRRA
jgi:3'-phosphoadenosine 5'-phosphosulfate sulfotransferase (PAPS reductase)/FAD synthetase